MLGDTVSQWEKNCMMILRHIYQKKAISECARCTVYICGNVSYKQEHVLVYWVKWTYTMKIFLKDKSFRQWKAQEFSKYDYFYNSTLRWFWETLLRSGVNPEVVYFLLILFLNLVLSQSEQNQHTVSFLVNLFWFSSELTGTCFRSVPWSACSWGLTPRPHPSYASTFWVSHIPALIHTLIKTYFSFSWKLSCLETNSFFMTRYEFIRRAINIKKFFMTHYEFIWGVINTKILPTKENYPRSWACKAYLVKIYFLIFYKI